MTKPNVRQIPSTRINRPTTPMTVTAYGLVPTAYVGAMLRDEARTLRTVPVIDRPHV